MLKLKASGLKPVDGVYAVNLDEKTIMNVYCDMTNNGGGWTLVVSSHSNSWTSSAMVRERNINKPALLQDYSILKYADKIKDNYVIGSSTFEFKIEAQDRGIVLVLLRSSFRTRNINVYLPLLAKLVYKMPIIHVAY